jgi:1-deoxy-D-xylulose-5-phosphate synthase
LDRDLILTWAARTGRVITIEENVKKGGFGSAVLELLSAECALPIKVVQLGLPDSFMEQGTQETLRRLAGIDSSAISQAAMSIVAVKK